MAKIDLKEALEIIRSGQWIKSLTCFTANLAKGTGGQLLELKNVRICRRRTLEESGIPTIGNTDIVRNPNHNYNFTVNLEVKGNKEIRKIHPILITQINGQQVL